MAVSRVFTYSGLRVWRACLFLLFLAHARCAWASLQIEAKWGTRQAATGTPVPLTVEIRWTGEADRFTVGTPALDMPEGLSIRAMSSSSSSRGDETCLTYTITLRAEKQGSYEPISISLPVYEKGATDPSTMVVKTDRLTVSATTLENLAGTRSRSLLIVAGIGVVVALAVALAVVVRRRRSRRGAGPDKGSGDPTGERLRGLLAQSRTFLVRGESLSFLETALTIERCLLEKDGSPEAMEGELLSLVEKVRYAGLRPEQRDLEKIYRSIELRVRHAFPKESGNGDTT